VWLARPCFSKNPARRALKANYGKPDQRSITHRAYELWEQAGKPDGRDEEFYHQAEKELRDAEDKSSPLRTSDNL
jgi:hypothetical protein